MSIYYRCPKCGSSYLAAGANAKFGGCTHDTPSHPCGPAELVGPSKISSPTGPPRDGEDNWRGRLLWGVGPTGHPPQRMY